MKAASILLLLFVQFVKSTDTSTTMDCGDAWFDASCDTTGKITDTLLNGACPEDCQRVLDTVISSCSEGDEYDCFGGVWPVDPNALLYHQFSQTNNKPTWRKCNYNYNATACDIAYGKADMTRFNETSYGPQLVEDPHACFKGNNNEVCSDACKAIIDGIQKGCPVGASYSPNEGPGVHTVKTWKYPQSMIDMSYNSPNDIGAFSTSCWNYYYSDGSSAGTTSAKSTTMIWALLSFMFTVALSHF